MEELQRLVELLKSENERLRNNEDGRSEASSSTASNLRKVNIFYFKCPMIFIL